MKETTGTILHWDEQSQCGAIQGDDGREYTGQQAQGQAGPRIVAEKIRRFHD